MAYPNPHYHPEWEAMHNRHAAARTRVEMERDRLARAGAMLSDVYRQAEAEFDHHHQACLAALKAQHATVQDYAAWLFREFRVDGDDWEGAIPVPVVDLDELHTVEEADRAWSRVRRIISDSAAERRLSLPMGQPDGLRAFADPASPSLGRYWREFSPRDLHPIGYAGEGGTRTLVTVDEQDDGWHVCFMQDWNTPGTGVTNAIERLATAVFREACALGEQDGAPASHGMRGWLTRRRAARARAAMLAPGRFHFYCHLPPKAASLLREKFDRVELGFGDGQYRGPAWSTYSVIPKAIQSARFDCALDAAAPNVQLGHPRVSYQRDETGRP